MKRVSSFFKKTDKKARMGQTEDMERKGKILFTAVSLLAACSMVGCKKNKDEVRF